MGWVAPIVKIASVVGRIFFIARSVPSSQVCFGIRAIAYRTATQAAECFERSATGARRPSVRHYTNWNIHLFLALNRHHGAHFVDKPALELLLGLKGAAADNQNVRIERVNHLVEEQSERLGLHAKDIPAHAVAVFGEATYPERCLTRIWHTSQFMSRILP